MSPGLAQLIFWVAAVSCAVAHAALIRFILAARPGAYDEDRRKHARRGPMRWGPDRRSPEPDAAHSSSRELEIGWALLPAFGLAALLVATWLTLPA